LDSLETILTRRSIRRYRETPVKKRVIEQLLRAAMAAPSSRNEQPWVFIVMDNRSLLDKVPAFHPYAAMIKTAPAAILVCADERRFLSEEIWAQDCAAATQNILLAAHGLGLGAVWLGIYPRRERVAGMTRLLSLPESIIPFSLVALGHSAEEKPPSNRFDASRIHWNGWGGKIKYRNTRQTHRDADEAG